MYGWKDEFLYFQCAACSCIQIAEVPDDLDRFYPPRYHDLSSVSRRLSGLRGRLRGLRYRLSLFPRGRADRLLGSLFAVRRRIGCLAPLSLDCGTRVLDLGCGNGSGFLWCLAGAGLTRLCGCDPFISHDVRYDNGLELRKCSI